MRHFVQRRRAVTRSSAISAARLGASLIMMLALLGCERSVYAGWDKEKTAEVADMARANSGTALAQVAELSERIDSLERERDALRVSVEDLERKSRELETDAGALRDKQSEIIRVVNDHIENQPYR